MPVSAHPVRRYRGKEIVMLRRLRKVVAEIKAHNTKYPRDDGAGNLIRRHLEFTSGDMTKMDDLDAAAASLLLFKWPPPT